MLVSQTADIFSQMINALMVTMTVQKEEERKERKGEERKWEGREGEGREGKES